MSTTYTINLAESIPTEPPINSEVSWEDPSMGRTKTYIRKNRYWENSTGTAFWLWRGIVGDSIAKGVTLTVTMPPARELPTESGSIIEASGGCAGRSFERTLLFKNGSMWTSLHGTISVFLFGGEDYIDPDWTEMKVVRKDDDDLPF